MLRGAIQNPRDDNYTPFDQDLGETSSDGPDCPYHTKHSTAWNLVLWIRTSIGEMGENLTAPLFSSIVLGGTAVNSTNAGLKETWISPYEWGKRIALARDEATFFDPSQVNTTAKKQPTVITQWKKK